MAQQPLFYLLWSAGNIQRLVTYDAQQNRAIGLITQAIDPQQPVEYDLATGAPDSWPFEEGDVVYQQCEGTDGVTIYAVYQEPYAAVAVDPTAAACSTEQPDACDLQASAVWDAATERVVATATTSHGPASFALAYGGPYFAGTNNSIEFGTEPMEAGARVIYVKDAGVNGVPCRAEAVFTIVRDTPPGPPAGYFDSFVSNEVSVLLYYVNDQQGRRVTVTLNPAGGNVSTPVPLNERGRAEGEQILTFVEGSNRVRLFSTVEFPFATLTVEPVTVDPEPVRGCTDPNATNYNPDATEDDGTCSYGPPDPGTELLTVAQAPTDWAPVHLPVLLTLTAQPDEDGEPREVLCCIDASADNGTTWQYCGAMRRTAGANKLVQFNLSEYLKSQFTITPPVVGPDASLSRRWRVRLGFAPAFTGTSEAEELRLDTLRVVNGAAPNGGTGAYLSDLIPLPEGYEYRLSKIGVTAVSNQPTLPATPAAPCPPYPIRLLWLNQRGGWNSYVFGGKHEYGTTTENGTTWTGQDRAQRYADRGTVRPTVNVYSDRLSPALAALVRTVRSSIQVYELPEVGAPIPVLVQENSFGDFRAANKAPTVDFTITYPRLAVQTQ